MDTSLLYTRHSISKGSQGEIHQLYEDVYNSLIEADNSPSVRSVAMPADGAGKSRTTIDMFAAVIVNAIR